MIIDYQLSPELNERNSQTDLASADAMDLRYSLLFGDIIFKDASCDLSAFFKWIPVVDFASALGHICNGLSKGSVEEHFDFTESSDEIIFKRDTDELMITATYAPGNICLPYDQFVKETKAFTKRMKSALVKEYPRLAQNPVFVELLAFGD